jgi:hypothetical protein
LSADQVPAVLDRLEKALAAGELTMPRVDASVLRMAAIKGPNPRCGLETVSLCPEVKTGRLVAYSIDAGLSREVALRRIAQTMGPKRVQTADSGAPARPTS